MSGPVRSCLADYHGNIGGSDRAHRLGPLDQNTHERFEITRNGRPAAVLLGIDDYEAMQETIAVLADSELVDSKHFH